MQSNVRIPDLAKSQARPLKLAYYNDPILRKKAERVNEINKELYELIDGMISTMDLFHGIGLAAPQVHQSLQLFIIQMPQEDTKGNPHWSDVQVFLNPKIISSSANTWSSPEGCLSIPTLHAEVSRPQQVTLEYIDLQGITRTQTFHRWAAKAILHEYDHLQGILFLDHLA